MAHLCRVDDIIIIIWKGCARVDRFVYLTGLPVLLRFCKAVVSFLKKCVALVHEGSHAQLALFELNLELGLESEITNSVKNLF